MVRQVLCLTWECWSLSASSSRLGDLSYGLFGSHVGGGGCCLSFSSYSSAFGFPLVPSCFLASPVVCRGSWSAHGGTAFWPGVLCTVVCLACWLLMLCSLSVVNGYSCLCLLSVAVGCSSARPPVCPWVCPLGSCRRCSPFSCGVAVPGPYVINRQGSACSFSLLSCLSWEATCLACSILWFSRHLICLCSLHFFLISVTSGLVSHTVKWR